MKTQSDIEQAVYFLRKAHKQGCLKSATFEKVGTLSVQINSLCWALGWEDHGLTDLIRSFEMAEKAEKRGIQ